MSLEQFEQPASSSQDFDIGVNSGNNLGNQDEQEQDEEAYNDEDDDSVDSNPFSLSSSGSPPRKRRLRDHHSPENSKSSSIQNPVSPESRQTTSNATKRKAPHTSLGASSAIYPPSPTMSLPLSRSPSSLVAPQILNQVSLPPFQGVVQEINHLATKNILMQLALLPVAKLKELNQTAHVEYKSLSSSLEHMRILLSSFNNILLFDDHVGDHVGDHVEEEEIIVEQPNSYWTYPAAPPPPPINEPSVDNADNNFCAMCSNMPQPASNQCWNPSCEAKTLLLTVEGDDIVIAKQRLTKKKAYVEYINQKLTHELRVLHDYPPTVNDCTNRQKRLIIYYKIFKKWWRNEVRDDTAAWELLTPCITESVVSMYPDDLNDIEIAHQHILFQNDEDHVFNYSALFH